MSTLKVNTIQDTTGNDALTIDSSGNVTASQGFVPSTQLSHRNLIINGAMQVAQRGTSWTNQTGNSYHLDRWQNQETGTAIFSMSQENSGGPDGFKYFQRVTTTTADTATASGDKTVIKQMIETGNLYHLDWGTSNAKAITISFWVRSSSTGTFSVALYHQAGTSYSYADTYTINTVDTWEYKTITIPGNTNIAFTDDATSSGLQVRFALSGGSGVIQSTGSWATGNYFVGTGQTQLTETVNSTFDLTGVQLEVGSVATPFEHRSYGEELARCQRYYQRFGGEGTYDHIGWGFADSSTQGSFNIPLRGNMRTEPSVSWNTLAVTDINNYTNAVTSISSYSGQTNTKVAMVRINSSGMTAYRPGILLANNSTSAYLDFDSEL